MGLWGVIASAFWREPPFCTSSSIYCPDLDSSDLTLLPVCVQVGERLWFEVADLCVPVLSRLDKIGSTAIWAGDLRVLSSLLQVFSDLMSCVSVDEKTEGSSWGVKCSCWVTLIPLGSLGSESSQQNAAPEHPNVGIVSCLLPSPQVNRGKSNNSKSNGQLWISFHSNCWKRWCFRR